MTRTRTSQAAGGAEAPGLRDVLGRLRAAERRAGRREGAARLVAVSKMQPEARVRAVLEAGHRLFGENRVQEAQARWAPLRDAYEGVALHLVGPLQTNKARAAMDLFDAIHTLDRERLAEAIARLAEARGACPDLYVQVNTGREPQKAGVAPEGAEALVARARALGLPVRGLMGIPPQDADPGPHFAHLARLATDLGLDGLSMGMSGDFERAVGEGATLVRVGAGVFGERPADRGAGGP